MRGVHPVFHVSVLRKHTPDQIEGRRTTPPDSITTEEGEEEWEVEEILHWRKRRSKNQFLVAWKGYGPEANSWEPEANLKNCKQLVDKFKTRFPTAPTKYKRTKRRAGG
ncbi:hypothetical protein PSTG_15591 [Puccinia striiformis f. sp. tritici PST-78]|uniref:Chromo domain-containing protein n=1 Tax=Puccinia striiformis f. sp. tritici PST-78 TaxID=1165861 RepID=A0A0L0UVD1_9BASI|nr:hypothetical protein PSTG_15591 [Puccinia striiformis f. sp. tritici PST-78]